MADFRIISKPVAIRFKCPFCEEDIELSWESITPPNCWGDDWDDVKCPCCWCISNEDIALSVHTPNHPVDFVYYEPKEKQYENPESDL